MVMIEAPEHSAVPEPGNLVRVRDRFWVVESVVRSSLAPTVATPTSGAAEHAVRLVPIDDRGGADPLTVFWEAEPGTEVRPQAQLPDPSSGLDDVGVFAAFLDAARWGAVTSADPGAFQAPFRAGIDIEEYQLLPLVKGLTMPRVTLLIADDVGLGKTIEAGLIAEELVLRGQAQKILVICPPTLSGKWQREMRDRFGLTFEVVDTEYVRRLRRERGVGINPFRSHPRLIVSIDWVKFESQMRWFDEFLPPDPNTYPRAFDLLIVDEAHQIAPAAVGRYAKDSLRTTAVRRLAPHFEHRLFLTATPHNGYAESFQSLLETLDPHRFAKGVTPVPRERDAVVVRRLKSHLRDLLPDGDHRFPKRHIEAIPVVFGADERELFELVDAYAAARRAAAATASERAAARLVTMLLKKRLLSSPAAFKLTLDEHIRSMTTAAERQPSARAIEAAAAALEDEARDDDARDELEREALAVVAAALPEVTESDEALLARLRARSLPYASPAEVLHELSAKADRLWRRPDAKAVALLDWIAGVCFPGGVWNDERVIVFTEYRDTLNYLHDILTAGAPGRPSMAGRLELIHGGVDAETRERIIREFNYNPRKTPVRVLLATDAASEGIDLHLACHRLVHADVPFNPNRMEQRNGRIDRHGQRWPVHIFHFVAATEDGEHDPIGYDHTFLFKVAEKVDEIRDDLGSVSPVLAERIEARMLGQGDDSLDIDALVAARRDQARADLKRIEQQFAVELAGVRDRYDASVDELDLTPASVERAVRVALRIAEPQQPDLIASTLERPAGVVPVFEIPDLTGTWGETLVGLHDEVEDVRLPVTFDPSVAHGHTDVGYLHVGHPLVDRCLRTLRTQVWGAAVDRKINRVTVRSAAVDEPVAVAHARVVVNGADGSTLDEVIEPAAVRVRGRQGRLNVGETRTAVESAADESPPAHVEDRYVAQWPRIGPALEEALRVRAEEVRAQRQRRMDDKRDREEQRLRSTLGDLRTAIERRLDELDASPAVQQLRLFEGDEEGGRQFEADMRALRDRLGRIDDDIAREVENLRTRYAVRDVNWFPVAVEILVPAEER